MPAHFDRQFLSSLTRPLCVRGLITNFKGKTLIAARRNAAGTALRV
jgi:hypothetical protein